MIARVLQYRTEAGTVDWAKVMEPEIAKEIMGERGRAAMALEAGGPEMMACRAMLAKALEADAAAREAAEQKSAAGAVEAAVEDVSVSVEENSRLLSQGR